MKRVRLAVVAVVTARRRPQALRELMLSAAAVILAMLVVPVAAQAHLTWTAATLAGQLGGQPLTSVACAGAGQCTAVDTTGTVITYDPSDPQAASSAQVSYPVGSESVKCPSATECVSAGITGTVTVFDPTNPAVRHTVAVNTKETDTGDGFQALSCASVTQCTVVNIPNYGQDTHQQAVTFMVAPPATPQPTFGSQLENVASYPGYVTGIVCPSGGSNCTVVGRGGGESTYNTSTGTAISSVTIDSAPLASVDCLPGASTTCVAVDAGGNAVTFDSGSGSHSANVIDSGQKLNSVSCPNSTTCDAVDASGRLVEFSPTGSGATATVALDSQSLASVACPTAGECTTVDTLGREVSADPQTGVASSPTSIDTGKPLFAALSCPSAALCSAIGFLFGFRLDFNPTTPGVASGSAVDPGNLTDAVSCPSISECVVMDGIGEETTFTPNGGASAPAVVDQSHEPLGVACPASSQCTAVDTSGYAVTFNPGSPSGTPVQIDTSAALDSIACPTQTQCTAVDAGGSELTFDPQSIGAPISQVVDSGNPLNSITCPSASECVAVDTKGNEVTFDPEAAAAFAPLPQSIDEGHSLLGVACLSANDCVAVDDAGRAVEGSPSGSISAAGAWTIESIANAGALFAVSCPSASECVAVDSLGQETTGTALLPVNTSPPGITGQLVSGQTLTEAHGTWQNAPDAYSYQWERCDQSGANCAPIDGATAPTYALSAGDVGHAIAVQETAFNDNGPGSPATSAPTSVVSAPLVPGRPAVPSATVTVTAVGPTSVTLSNTVVPDGLGTTAGFEYGFDPKYYGKPNGQIQYTEQSSAGNVGSDFSPHVVTVTISGLTPHAVYRARLTAVNADGDARGPSVRFTTAKAPPPPPPQLGKTVDVTPMKKGLVLVKPPKGMALRVHGKKSTLKLHKGHGFVPLTQARQVPVGTQIDARRGTVELSSALGKPHGKKKPRVQTVTFGKGLFTTSQVKHGPNKGLTTAKLIEGAYKGAPTYRSCAAAPAKTGTSVLPLGRHKGSPGKTVLQTLTASDHGGKFATKGRYAAGTVRGTVWTTTDRCDGTIIAVTRGTVSVLDLTTRKVILVHAGHHYFARAPKR